MDADIAGAYQLSRAFLAMVRDRRASDLETWITAATGSGIDALTRFACGLQEDLAAFTAGLTLAWSHGPVEGQLERIADLERLAGRLTMELDLAQKASQLWGSRAPRSGS